ncbi:MAG TPA: LysR family transcriptional regulator [Burkholderiaceae bacterium]|nr:LysR family transcriptional regulator [Burkholderiaceae bacterium]
METKWIEDFLALADTRSFSRAARLRHVTQPALSRRIQALEAWLGVTLVDRSSSPLALTAPGRFFRGIAADILRQIYAARSMLRGEQEMADNALHLAVAHTLMFTYFPGWLKDLNQSFGPLRARVSAVNVPEAVGVLVDGGCDLAMVYHHPQLPVLLDPNRFPYLVLRVDAMLPYCAPDDGGKPMFRLPGRKGSPLPFVAYAPGAFLGNVVEMILLKSPEPHHLSRCFETHMSEAVKEMLVAGHGLGWLPESCVRHELDEHRLLPAGGPAWGTELEVRLYRSMDNTKPLLRQLWQYLSENVARVPEPA